MSSTQTHTLGSYYYKADTKAFVQRATDKTLGENDVLIRTTHSGLCTTDVHAKNSGSGCSLGHEGIGFVEEAGAKVKQFKKDQRVGWGWLNSSCRECSTCKEGYRQYCAQARGFAFSDTDQGSLGNYRIMDADFAYAIPDAIASKHAAPLMCAGASTFEALDAGGAKTGDRVGVLGIGGLGHMAIQFAKAMGCQVTALSNGPTKAPDAFKLGADEFRDTNKLHLSFSMNSSTGKLESQEATEPQNINTLLIMSNTVPNLSTLFPLLARRATIVLMTIQHEPLTIPYMPFILPGHKLIASTEASVQNHEKMLQFVAENGIEPWVEEFAMDGDGVGRAFQKLESGQMRYRGVLVREDAEGAQW